MEKVTYKIDHTCYHCGENCNNSTIRDSEKYFCCSGCKMVYDILNQNNLCTYYTISENPGITQKDEVRKNKFSFLDDIQVQAKLIQFTDGTNTRVLFYLPQMHCSSCIWLLENLHKINAGIKGSMVDFPKREITINFNSKECSLKEVAELLTAIGYEPHINLSDLNEKEVKYTNRSRIFKLGIAGFCFGNIMMLSFPEYFSSGIYDEKGFRDLFSYLILGLSLPVFFYSASEFYISAWKGLKHRFLNIDAPIVLAIVITFTRSVVEIINGTGSGYLDSMSGIVFFMLAGRIFQDRVQSSIAFDRDYKSYFPIAVAVKNGDKEESVPVSKLKVGDRLVIRHNELIPADSILFYGKANIDYSFVTGESLPVPKGIGEIIYAGGKQIGTAIEMEVVKEVSQSYLTQLWNNEAFQTDSEKQLSFIHQLSKSFTLILFSIAAIASIYWWIFDPSKIINSLTAILIVACPCSLLLSATFTNGNIIRIFNKNKFYVKNATVIEALANANTIVFDKTGTITKNESSALLYEGIELSDFQKQVVRSLAAQSTHPLSKAVFNELSQFPLLTCTHFSENTGLGIQAFVAGSEVKMGSYFFIHGQNKTDDIASKVYIQMDGKNLGCFVLKNKYREGLSDLIASLRKKYTIALLSGDNDAEKKYLQNLLGNDAEILFYQTPQDKLNYIALLQKKGKKVIMIGDGLNDAGALRISNAGIAVNDNSNNFSPACDAVLNGTEFNKLANLINYAKEGKSIIVGSFVLSILYNFVGISFAAQGDLSPLIAAILMPASSISILIFTVGLSALFAKIRGLT